MVFFGIFLNIDLRSATSIESSRRDLLNNVAEQHGSILKNNQNAHHPLCRFIPQNRHSIPENGVSVFTVYIFPINRKKIGVHLDIPWTISQPVHSWIFRGPPPPPLQSLYVVYPSPFLLNMLSNATVSRLASNISHGK